MKRSNVLIVIYVSILAIIIFFKFIFWIKMDIPIGKLSIVYLLFLVFVLSYKNKVTYVLLWILCATPFVWKLATYNISGFIPTEYTYPLYKYFNEEYRKTALFFLKFPYYFSVLLFVTSLTRGIRNLYGVRLNKSSSEHK